MTLPKNLITPLPSSAWMRSLKGSLADFVGGRDPLMHVIETNCAGLHASHRVYVLGLEEIHAGGGIEMTRSVGWRFLAGGHPSSGQAAGCQTTDDQAGGSPAKVKAVLRTTNIADVLADINRLGDLPEVKDYPNNVYELRVIRVAGLYLEAFWLNALKNAPADLIVPYGLLWDDDRAYVKLPAGGKLKRMAAIPAPQFMDTIRDYARQRLGSNSARAPR